MTTREAFFTGHDGLRIFQRSWMPTGQPRAAVALVHGLIEHSGCHAGTALQLACRGFAVHAIDLRGHGRSDGPRGDVGSFEEYLLDLDVFFDRVRCEAAGQPLFLMGNSMGGLVAALWTVRRQPILSGLILSGPLLALADKFYPRLRRWAGAAAAVAPRWRIVKTPLDWLASDRRVVERFRGDPLVFQGRLTARLAAEVLRAAKSLHEQAAQLKTPLLILHGAQDRICGPAGSQAFRREAGSVDKTLHLYEGFYHEVFDEPPPNRALADLARWLGEHLAAAPCGCLPG